MVITGRSIIISAVGIFLALLILVVLSLVFPGASQAQGPTSAANKLMRVSVDVNKAMTQAINQDQTLIAELRRQGRCWGRAIDDYQQAGGRDLQGGPLSNLWLPYIALSQKQLVQQATAGTANWGRGKLRASRFRAQGDHSKRAISGGLPSPGPRPNWRPGDSGGIAVPNRPRRWSVINNGYRQSLRELAPVDIPATDSCQLLASWRDQDFGPAWKLISASLGLQNSAKLRQLWKRHVVNPFKGRVKTAQKIDRWGGDKGGQRRLTAFIFGPYKRSEAIYQRGVYLGLGWD